MKRIQTGLRMDSDIVEELKQRAEENGCSLNSYMEKILTDSLREDGYQPESRKDLPDVLHIRLTPEMKEKIKKRAEYEGMSVRALLDDFVSRSAYAKVCPVRYDLTDMNQQTAKLIHDINGIYTVMQQSGQVYKGELQTALRILGQINDTVNHIYKEELDSRHKLEAAARKQIFKEIKTQRVKKGERNGHKK